MSNIWKTQPYQEMSTIVFCFCSTLWTSQNRYETFNGRLKQRSLVETAREYGAFVDVGSERAGLVHISRMSDGFAARLRVELVGFVALFVVGFVNARDVKALIVVQSKTWDVLIWNFVFRGLVFNLFGSRGMLRGSLIDNQPQGRQPARLRGWRPKGRAFVRPFLKSPADAIKIEDNIISW